MKEQKQWPTRRNTSAATAKTAGSFPPAADLNDIEVLKRYVTEYGKIIPARVTGVTAMQQRQIKKGVRRARNMGLMA